MRHFTSVLCQAVMRVCAHACACVYVCMRAVSLIYTAGSTRAVSMQETKCVRSTKMLCQRNHFCVRVLCKEHLFPLIYLQRVMETPQLALGHFFLQSTKSNPTHLASAFNDGCGLLYSSLQLMFCPFKMGN